MKTIYYNQNIKRAQDFASTVRVNVTETCDDEWFVCVNTYPNIDEADDNGNLPNPSQVINTLKTEAEAVSFAKSFNPTHLKIQKGGRPWYADESKWRYAFD